MENPDAKICGFCTILFIVFLVLKVAGVTAVANWNWLWVFSPIWMPLLGILGFIVGMCLLALVAFFVELLREEPDGSAN